MLEVARYEGERRLVVAGAITAAACFYAAMFVALTPSFTNVDLDAILEAYPDQLVVGFGMESLNSLAGLLWRSNSTSSAGCWCSGSTSRTPPPRSSLAGSRAAG